jgi:hypothetical protein
MAIIETDAEPVPDLNIPADQLANYEVHVFPTVDYINDNGEARNAGTLEQCGNRTFATVWKFGMSAPGGAKQIDAGEMESTPAGVTFAALIVLKSNGRMVKDFSVFGRGFRVPASPTSTTWANIWAANRGIIPAETMSANVTGALTVGGLSTFNGGSIFNGSVLLNGLVSGAAWDGKQNALGYTPLNAANNLSDLANLATAKSNLGLGTMAAQSANSVNILGGDLTGVALHSPTISNPTYSGNINIGGDMTAVRYHGDGSALTGIASGTGGVSNTGSTSIIGDNNNDGTGDIALLIGASGRSLYLNNAGNVGLWTSNPQTRIDVAGNPRASAANIFRFRTNDPGRADIGLVYQSATNALTSTNPFWAGTLDHIMQLGYNVGASGKQVSGEHLFAIVNESNWVVPDGTGRTQDEFYLQYISRDNSASYRPFAVTTDLDAHTSVIGLYSNVVFGDQTGNNPFIVVGGDDAGGSFNLYGNTAINFGAGVGTQPRFLINDAAIGLIGKSAADGLALILAALDGTDGEIRLFDGGNVNGGGAFTLSVGGYLGVSRGLRYAAGWQFQRHGDGAWLPFGNMKTEDATGAALTNSVFTTGGTALYFDNAAGSNFYVDIATQVAGDQRALIGGGILTFKGGSTERLKITPSALQLWDGSQFRSVSFGDAVDGKRVVYIDA